MSMVTPILLVGNFFTNLLFEKQPASFHCEYEDQEATRRLAKEVRRWPFLSPFRKSLVGRVRPRGVSIACFTPFVGNCFAPVFYGSFVVRDGVTVLDGYFSISLISRIYHSIWLGFCLVMAVFCFAGAIIGPVSGPPAWPQWMTRLLCGLVPLLMILFFVAYVRACKWLARKHIPFISARIQRILSGAPVA